MPLPRINTTAARFVEFLNWLPDDYCFDDSNEQLWEEQFDHVDGKWVAKNPEFTFCVRYNFGGFIQWQGNGPKGDFDGKDSDVVFEQWEKDQVSTVAIFRVPKENLAKLIELATSRGAVHNG
jgi:hypothetical protein